MVQVSPPISLTVINTDGSTGANSTSANISIIASTSPSSLISNPDFTTGADGWYYTTNDGLLGAVWLDSDGVSQGLVLVYNRTLVSQISDSVLYLYQNFTVPELVSSVDYEVTYRLASQPYIYNVYLYLGVYDWDSGTMTWLINGKTVTTSSSYTTDSGSSSISLTPSDHYALVIGVRLYQVLYFIDGNFYFLIDSANISYTPSTPRFDNDVLGLKTSGNYSVRLVINNVTGGDNMDVNLTLYNYNNDNSDTIQIINGTPSKTVTEWIPIYPNGNTLYYDAKLEASVEALQTNTTLTVDGSIEYIPENGGVTVDYPIKINITSS